MWSSSAPLVADAAKLTEARHVDPAGMRAVGHGGLEPHGYTMPCISLRILL